MLPNNDGLFADLVIEEQPSKTFAMNYEKENVTGYCDRLKAVQQAIFLILNIERYSCPIVSWNYGVELAALFGKPVSYCVPEIERRITEALMNDDRILKVYNFTFDFPKKGVIHTRFDVDTTAGMLSEEKEVYI